MSQEWTQGRLKEMQRIVEKMRMRLDRLEKRLTKMEKSQNEN